MIGFEFSLFVPVVMSGLGDSINPCNFTTLLIFIMILSRIGYTPIRIVVYGGLFICFAGGVQFLSVLGSWDQLLTLPIVLDVLRFGYLLTAAAFLYFGVVHILDWQRYKKDNDTKHFKLQLPVFFQDLAENCPPMKLKRILAVIQNISFVGFAAISMSLVGAVYPQNEYVFIVHSFLMSGGDRGFVYQNFSLYVFAMVLPLILAWVTILSLALRKKHSAKIISYYKGILSALFIATGIGLGCFFLN